MIFFFARLSITSIQHLLVIARVLLPFSKLHQQQEQGRLVPLSNAKERLHWLKKRKKKPTNHRKMNSNQKYKFSKEKINKTKNKKFSKEKIQQNKKDN